MPGGPERQVRDTAPSTRSLGIATTPTNGHTTWAGSSPTRGACMTRWAMSGSGAGTSTTPTCTAPTECCVAVDGSTSTGAAEPPCGGAATRLIGSTTSDSASLADSPYGPADPGRAQAAGAQARRCRHRFLCGWLARHPARRLMSLSVRSGEGLSLLKDVPAAATFRHSCRCRQQGHRSLPCFVTSGAEDDSGRAVTPSNLCRGRH
jgi:hypothetical protein